METNTVLTQLIKENVCIPIVLHRIPIQGVLVRVIVAVPVENSRVFGIHTGIDVGDVVSATCCSHVVHNPNKIVSTRYKSHSSVHNRSHGEAKVLRTVESLREEPRQVVRGEDTEHVRRVSPDLRCRRRNA